MKKIYTLALAVALSAAAFAQENIKIEPVVKANDLPASSVVPVVKPAQEDGMVLKELEFNFGKIPQGKPVTHVFEVVNSGKDSLRIQNVQASCGCTTPEWEHDKAVAPNGGKTKITVGYNAAAEGMFTKTITITYNGSLSKVITIKGEVWKTPAESAPVNKAIDGLKN